MLPSSTGSRSARSFMTPCLFIFGFSESSLLRGFSLVVASGGYSPVAVHRLPLGWLLLLWRTGSRVHGLQQVRLTVSWAQARWLWCTGLVPQHVGSSRIRDRTRVSCINWQADSWPLNHQGSPFMALWFQVICQLSKGTWSSRLRAGAQRTLELPPMYRS